jgi:iron complex outermembrane receptor protein
MLYRFFLRLAAAGAISIFVVPAQAQTDTVSSLAQLTQRQSDSSIPSLSDLKQPATTIDEWVSQSVQTSVVQITGVRLNATEVGLEIVLETVTGLAIPETYVVDNALIADIPNAVLTPPSGFQQANPIEGIASVSVTNLPNNFVRVAITGVDTPPIADVRTEAQGLVLDVAVEETEDDVIEIVVTGEQEEGYRVPDTSVGTRTDTPLRDIPQSIQVVLQQVLRDQQVTRLDDALRNVPGVNQAFNFGPTGSFTIRGFDAVSTNSLRDGLIDPLATEVTELSSIEQVEVLKDPASVLLRIWCTCYWQCII